MRVLTQISYIDPGVLLKYTVSTNPSPIQVSPSVGDAMKAAITVVVDNPNIDPPTPVYVEKLELSLPVDPEEEELPTALVPVGTSFKAMVSPSETWKVSDPTTDGTVTVTPKTGNTVELTSEGLHVTLYDIPVNTKVGTSNIQITEYTSTDPDGPFDTPNVWRSDLGKFPYAFSLGDFWAESIQVNYGLNTTLHWLGSEGNADYYILYGTHSESVTDKFAWPTPNLIDTTTFFLKVDAKEQGETVTHLSSLTVTVEDPSLTATTLEVLKDTTLDGPLLAKGKATLQDGLAVTGGEPTADGLDVGGSLRILTGSNPVRFTSAWSGFPDIQTNQAEISNDTARYQMLMIVGNKSAGMGRRVGLWDRLEVNGSLFVQGGAESFSVTNGLYSFYVGANRGGGPYCDIGAYYAGDNNHPYGYWANLILQRDPYQGNVGIGTTQPTERLEVAGNIRANSFLKPSDARAKTNVAGLTDVLDKLGKIRGVSFERTKSDVPAMQAPRRREIGVIAQEVERVFPELVSTHGDEAYKAVDYSGLTSVLVEVAKELLARNEELRCRVEALEGA